LGRFTTLRAGDLRAFVAFRAAFLTGAFLRARRAGLLAEARRAEADAPEARGRAARRAGWDERRFARFFIVFVVFRAAFRVRAVALRFAITGVLSGSSQALPDPD
jgi:hypothetical protein